MVSVKTALFSFSVPCFIESDCQEEQGKNCARSLRFERNREVPEDFLHMAEQGGCGLSWRGHCLVPARSEVSGYRQNSLLVPVRTLKVQRPFCTSSPTILTAA